jgi:protein O-GlcNAc transferase
MPRNAQLLAFLIEKGISLQQTGNLDSAIDCFRRAVAIGPDVAEAFSHLGAALEAHGKLDEAISAYRTALALQPDIPAVLNNLGTVLQDKGFLDEAASCFSRALLLAPENAGAHYNLGNCLQAQGRLAESVACYERALELSPKHALALNNLGNVLLAQRKQGDAIVCYRQVLELEPGYAEAHYNLGVALHSQGQLDEAVMCYRRALELKPEYFEAHLNLGIALQDQRKLDEAIHSYKIAIKRKPNDPGAYTNLGGALQEQGKLREAIEHFRHALKIRPDYLKAYTNLLFTLWFCPDFDLRAIYEEHRRWSRQWEQPLAKHVTGHTNNIDPNRRLRIGYVSPDFRAHCQSLFTVPLLSSHDHERFEIVCYADVPNPDDLTTRLRSYADRWADISWISDEDLAQLVRQDEIDILVDLTMHMDRGHSLAFARKPAPVQVCWLAYPGTSGLQSIDYRLTDSYLDPPGLHDQYYSERSIRLPDCFWCYDPLTNEPSVNGLPALENGYITFGCLNNFCKVNCGVLEVWARVLLAVANSRLLLLAPEGSVRRDIVAFFNRAGVSADRIVFAARQPQLDYLRLYNQIDIGLDTFPYNGHTTSLDSFWMGVPVVTLVGKTAVGRAGLCQLYNIGLPELIAESDDQFIEIAVTLASDLPRLSGLRASLRERMENSSLMNAPRFTRNIEAAYRRMWQQWCAEREHGIRV